MTRQDPEESYLYSAGRQRRDTRFCRTHALIADLFAKSSAHPAGAAAWGFNARAWAELAEIKERESGRSWGVHEVQS